MINIFSCRRPNDKFIPGHTRPGLHASRADPIPFILLPAHYVVTANSVPLYACIKNWGMVRLIGDWDSRYFNNYKKINKIHYPVEDFRPSCDIPPIGPP